MPVTRRSLALSARDSERIESLRRRSGRSATASEAVRVATAVLVADSPIEHCDSELDQLAGELAAGKTTWGYSVPEDDDEALSSVLRSMERGSRRPSRSEGVRLGLLRAAALGDVDVARAFAALDYVPIGGAGAAWRAGSSIHDELIEALGADFRAAGPDELQRRIEQAIDPRVGWSPIQVAAGAGGLVVHAWRTKDVVAAPVPLYDSDTARTFARRLVPYICDAEDAARATLRDARDSALPGGRRGK